MQRRAVLVTRNVKYFERLEVEIVNPFAQWYTLKVENIQNWRRSAKATGIGAVIGGEVK